MREDKFLDEWRVNVRFTCMSFEIYMWWHVIHRESRLLSFIEDIDLLLPCKSGCIHTVVKSTGTTLSLEDNEHPTQHYEKDCRCVIQYDNCVWVTNTHAHYGILTYWILTKNVRDSTGIDVIPVSNPYHLTSNTLTSWCQSVWVRDMDLSFGNIHQVF